MSTNSSPKKNSITSSDEYDRVQSGGTGAGWSGIHYELMNVLRKYGMAPNGREAALRMLKQLLNEYEKTYLGTKDQSDDEYLSKFDDL